jgi:hypothetical protein
MVSEHQRLSGFPSSRLFGRSLNVYLFMAESLITDTKDIEYAQKLLTQAKTKEDMRMAQSILLPHQQKMTFAQTADMLGVSQRSIPRLRQNLRLKRKGKHKGGTRGGRHRQNMSLAQEKSFLNQWNSLAAAGRIVVVSGMRQALSEQLQKPVSESYMSRLLARNNWRKTSPGTRHPKADVPGQKRWKKSSRKTWMPCARVPVLAGERCA